MTRCVLIPDDLGIFREQLTQCVATNRLVIVTGGLGPTSDDLTREVISEVANRKLVFREEIWNDVQSRFGANRISPANRKQALVPEGFDAVPNRVGTAPGLLGTIDGALVIALPGPPQELRQMFDADVCDAIDRKLRGGTIDSDREDVGTIDANPTYAGSVYLVPESTLEEALSDLRAGVEKSSDLSGIAWGTRVEYDRIVFRLWSCGDDEAAAVFAQLRRRFGSHRVRCGDVSPAQVLHDALHSADKSVATAESCTGGLLGKLITDIPGSSRSYLGGFVVYSNELKERLLQVDPTVIETCGAVSREVVCEMATHTLANTGADYAIAISGVAGPEGGSAEKPVGTVWIAVEGKTGKGVEVCTHSTGSRDGVRRKAAVAACILAESVVLGRELLDSRDIW